jgi:hypothetical protein
MLDQGIAPCPDYTDPDPSHLRYLDPRLYVAPRYR